ncbi:hypothetical protein RJ640_004091 [Escallonia rubra]|uniref:Uncharacterized protein n=1 Tax=Escallonia rubra TaxID=112253 RepID=A0AA88RW21_9ASTE|nr:hypothetical protein RJ640_004091 [Escallonia rubra]
MEKNEKDWRIKMPFLFVVPVSSLLYPLLLKIGELSRRSKEEEQERDRSSKIIYGTEFKALPMNDMASQLKGLDMEISEDLFVHLIMTSLPAQFGPFKINYNTQKEKWEMSELISMCVQEEERLKFKRP